MNPANNLDKVLPVPICGSSELNWLVYRVAALFLYVIFNSSIRINFNELGLKFTIMNLAKFKFFFEDGQDDIF